ncbi:MAG TPA: glycosyltransferase, partial [Actinomycetales bacterium]
MARALTWAGTAGSLALTAHTVVNLRLLRTPPDGPRPAERLSVLLPVRDEAHRLEPTLRSLLAALDHHPHPAQLLVLDDESTDGT